VGLELYYECLDANTNFYKITLKQWRWCTGIPFADSIYVAIYDTLGNLVNGPLGLKMNLPDSVDIVTIPNETYNLCLFAPPNVCVQEAVYEGFHFFPNLNLGGYHIAFQQCCRNGSISNLMDPGGTGSSTYVTIPEVNIAECNSSVQYDQYPPTIICMGDTFIYDHSGFDPDGDSIVYELCNATDGNFTNPQTGTFQSNIAPTKWINTFYDVDYVAGTGYTYSATDPIYAPNLPFSIDPQTGILTGLPELEGQYVVAICAYEYRDGELLTVNKRDFQFNVAFCVDDVSAGFYPKICGDNTVEFINTSWHGTYYDWDFGVTTMITDTSTQSDPVYTYQDSGTFDVSMIVNKQYECADTAEFTVTVPQLFPAFNPLAGCLNDTVDFSDSSISGPDSGPIVSWDWDFGDSETATIQNPSHLFTDSLDANGDPIVVIMVVTTVKGCIDTAAVALHFYPFPIIDAGEDIWASYGEGFPINATGGVSYSWFPSEGLNNPNVSNPLVTITTSNTHIEKDPEVLHDSIIFIVTGLSPDGCVSHDTVTVRILDPGVAIPNAFSPNGDGQNDIINLITVGVEEILEFKIFNRWGQVVYESVNLEEGWDGIYNAEPQEIGNYAYYFKVKTLHGDVLEGSGDIALLR
jgi:gliding motility-associated-like protein